MLKKYENMIYIKKYEAVRLNLVANETHRSGDTQEVPGQMVDTAHSSTVSQSPVSLESVESPRCSR